MKRKERVGALLDRGILPMWRKLDSRERDAVAQGFLDWTGARLPSREDDPSQWEQLELARYLREQLDALATRHGELSHRFRIFQERMTLAESESTRQALMLEFLDSLGTTPSQSRGDRLALSRWMDVDAVAERFDRERSRIERRIRFCLERLGPLARELCAAQATVAGAPVWDVLDLEATLQTLLGFPADPRIRESALACLGTALEGLGERSGQRLSPASIQYVYRAVLDPRQSIWLQCEALDLLARLAPGELGPIIEHRLAHDLGGDSMFFRRRLVEAVVAALPDVARYADALRTLATDASPFVREAVAESLTRIPPAMALELWLALIDDEVPAVAGRALLQTASLLAEADVRHAVTDRFVETLHSGMPEFPLRVAMHAAPQVLARVRHDWPGNVEGVHRRLERQLTSIHQHHPRTDIRRNAATARELLRGVEPPEALRQLPLHGRISLDTATGNVIEAARRFIPLALHGFGFNLVQRGRRLSVIRDWLWRPRLWRFLHESRRPATDKRQNYPHTRGRVYPGLVHVPSACLAEISPTKVPGEPLHIADEGGWRPWLPLLDQVLSALDQDGPVQPLRIVTAEGVTTVEVPESLRERLRAKWALTRRFGEVAALRNWTPDSAFTAHAYVDALRGVGIRCTFAAHAGTDGDAYPEDPRLRRFIPAATFAVSGPLQDMRDYFYSIYQNSLVHLLVFIAAVGAWFFGQHVWLNRLFRGARRRLPLVMGGWGTRGKSGTERLKAAVMSALGLRVLSKTTGCEAMFLFGHPNRVLSEMFLFRPYDKATIWEQARLTRMAADLETDVMLWECMGLNPGYVRVLQHDWMRDDVSTITNCFPDHEDIQGPAGVDLPLVIREFIPRGGDVYTSEENMLPYLAERAHDVGASFQAVGWLEIGLLTPDILGRFPYQEHPANIALVARMFEGLGLRRDFALKEMADRVVPDLGVLKVYPQAAYEGRRIEFINGMSANERHGCLSNWERTGMARHRLDIDPGVWTTTVVNNRADRVARSQVFAAILVNDIGADRHFLIGGNLDGLLRFIRESFDEFVASFDWQDAETGKDGHLAMLDAVLARWRVPLDSGQADARLRALCAGLDAALEAQRSDESPEALLARVAERFPEHEAALRARWLGDLDDTKRVAAARAAVERADAQTPTNVRDELWHLFSARLVPVHDYYTPGNVLVRETLRAAPPGALVRAMGIQNIKGTGLDFVYRWQAWDSHAVHLNALAGTGTDSVLAAAQVLAASTELGVLESEALREALARLGQGGIGQTDILQSLVTRIERNIQTNLQAIESYRDARKDEGNRVWRWLMNTTERLLDAGDAVRRRRTANALYADLVAGRISSARAAYELKLLNQRQKGGWFTG